MVIIFGLLSSFIWGIGDFSGGYASKKINVYTVTFISQVFGTCLFIIFAIITKENIPSIYSVLMSGVAGLFGGMGIVTFYYALASSKMGIVAPVSAVVTALIPVIVGTILEGSPKILQYFSFLLIIISVWLITNAETEVKTSLADLKLPFFAGLNFGFFFVFIDLGTQEDIFIPMIFARVTSLSLLLIIGIYKQGKSLVKTSSLKLLAFVGVADASGNLFFALASQTGRLDIAATLSSLYPVSTVVLARFILKEKMRKTQLLGIVGAIIAIVLITL